MYTSPSFNKYTHLHFLVSSIPLSQTHIIPSEYLKANPGRHFLSPVNTLGGISNRYRGFVFCRFVFVWPKHKSNHAQLKQQQDHRISSLFNFLWLSQAIFYGWFVQIRIWTKPTLCIWFFDHFCLFYSTTVTVMPRVYWRNRAICPEEFLTFSVWQLQPSCVI